MKHEIIETIDLLALKEKLNGNKTEVENYLAALRNYLLPLDFEQWLYKYLFRMHRVVKSIRVADIRTSARRQLLDGSVKEKNARIKLILDELADQGILVRNKNVPRAYINPCYTFTDLTPMLEIM